MKELCACAAQFDVAHCDAEANRRAAVEAVAEAARRGADLVVLPELVNCGYPFGAEPDAMRRYYDCAEPVSGRFREELASAAAEHGVHVVAGMLERHPTLSGGMCNSVLLLRPDGGLSVQRKLHLPRVEKRYFFAGDRLEPFETELGRVGVLVCADNSFPEAARILALKGADLIAVAYAALRTPNPETYRWMVATRAYENQVYVVAANRTGRTPEGEFGGRSTIAGPDGAVLATLEEEDGFALARLGEDRLLAERLRQTRYRDRRPDLYAALAAGASS